MSQYYRVESRAHVPHLCHSKHNYCYRNSLHKHTDEALDVGIRLVLSIWILPSTAFVTSVDRCPNLATQTERIVNSIWEDTTQRLCYRSLDRKTFPRKGSKYVMRLLHEVSTSVDQTHGEDRDMRV